MNSNQLFAILFFVATVFLSEGGVSTSSFQDGRTVGKDNWELTASLNGTQSPNLTKDDDADDIIEEVFFPSLEVFTSYGVAEKVDVGVKLTSTTVFIVFGKFQVLGDRTSKFALALGADIGTFALFPTFFNASGNVFLSAHPSENFTIYLNPRVMY
ncbi:MAG: hypothetical protein KA974_04685 [Saprospiraceae bacterium]|nr:hypothetical protein [Saprospiraceae bacterium]MBP7699234.1 hypothetical protein [Saprospiraceae bacterium]